MSADTNNENTSSAGSTQPVKKKGASRVKKKAAKKSIRSKTSKKGSKKKTGESSCVPWTFPKNSLEDSLVIARAIEDKFAGRLVKASSLAITVGYKSPSNRRFLELLRSANQYGLVSGSSPNSIIRLEPIGEEIVAPISSAQRQDALLTAFLNVEQFKSVEKFYQGKRIPEDEYFENTLVHDFNIPRDRIKTFIEVFLANLRYLILFNVRHSTSSDAVTTDQFTLDFSEDVTESTPTYAPRSKKRVREFLDTCFVMMPFGDWPDRYYQDIYIKSIKDAGFEPIRGDELFTTGAVVEQIWEQVQKSTVLLADLSDKNANVFYELGLAHAASKPVILTAPQIDDVPFDLRHLRVIVYDIREPQWAEKLAKNVTEHLKNAKTDPAKSIPQPFRENRNEETDEVP